MNDAMKLNKSDYAADKEVRLQLRSFHTRGHRAPGGTRPLTVNGSLTPPNYHQRAERGAHAASPAPPLSPDAQIRIDVKPVSVV